jgi:hypothetical protein
VTVVVIVGQNVTLITSEREFDLGIVRANERIVRELQGTRVVGVTVVRAGEIAEDDAEKKFQP